MISKPAIPGLFITGTDTGVGKTVVASAIARQLRLGGQRVAVCKPIATGCEQRREGLVSEDAELLAAAADTKHPLDIVCPQRYVEPLAPGVAAERAKKPVDWQEVDRALQWMQRDADVLVVEGVGGAMVPLDDRHTVIDLAVWLGLPAIVVARPVLGTINHTLLTIEALRRANVKVAGVVINGYVADPPDIATETNPRVIERWGRTDVISLFPRADHIAPGQMPVEVAEAASRVDWQKFAEKPR